MKNSTLSNLEIDFKNRFYCCIENLKGNFKFLMVFVLFMASFSQGVSAQGTLVPACNLIGPLTACVVPNPNDTSGDMVINIEVARSGAPNLIDAQHNANFAYSFPSNSAGAFIRSYGNVVYNSFTNRTTQTLIVFPGTSTSEFNLQLLVTNTDSSPNTFCECSKSVSVSRVAASSSYAPITCYGQTTTLTAVGQFSDIGQYTYTLLPSGPSNTTGVFPGLAGSEAGITYTVNVESAEGCSTTTSQTITQPAFNPVVLNCPESSSISACQSTEAITAAFNAWLNSFNFSGGTNAGLTRSPQNPALPALCGGSTEVTWTVTDQCGQPQSCTRTFTITPAPAVVVGQPANSSTPACSYADQAAANTAFAAWLAQFTVSGGCAPQGSYGTPAAPSFCGGTTSVTYTVTDRCYQTSTVTRTFTITAPPAVVVGQPVNSSTSACIYADQAAANTAFAAWLAQFTVSGGCAPQGSFGTPSAPAFCGGSTTVTYTVTDRCYQTSTVTRTFTITAPAAVLVNQPANSTTSACIYADQAAANTAFAAWLAQFTVSGGCAPQGSFGTPVAPPFCGGTTSVTYTVIDRCYQTSTVTRTFTITAPAAVVVGQPANSTTSACIYASQEAANAAFASWLAQFTVSGGCAPQGSFGTPSAPAFCGGTTSVTYTVTDRCYQTSTVTRTFTITAPAQVVVGHPANSTTPACSYADQAAANAAFAAWLAQFTVSGGCTPQGSFGTPVAPPYCGGSTTVTYTVTDRCYQTTSVTGTFTITAAPAVVIGQPANSTTPAGTYADQAAADAAFAAWLAQFTVSGGCAPQGSYGQPTAPPYCGGSTTVTYTVTDRCYQTTSVTRTFTITAAPTVVVGQPANSSTAACVYPDQAAANAAFAAWLAQFTVSGGIAPTGSFGDVTPSAPAFCGGTTTVTYTVTDRCYQTTSVTRTFTITAPAPVVVGQPANSSTSACIYADQQAANTAFAAWLAQFTVSGGCSPSGSFGTEFGPNGPQAPSFCGGSITVTYTVGDRCYAGSAVTRTFTITAPAAVVVNQPADSSTSACTYASQEAANAAFAAWLAQFTVSGGCAPQGSYGQVAAPAFCGGSTTVTYTVTDKCYQTSTVTRTFTITAPAAVVVGQPANSSTAACSYADQAAANTAFAAWLAQFTVSGGCAPQGSFGAPVAPPFCGGSTTVTYTVTDRCYQTSTATATFTITGSAAVVVGQPANSTTPACSYADQAAADAAFAAWLAQFTVSGGCAPQGSYGTPSAPAFCGGSTTVTYTVTDRCNQTTTVTRTFTITAPAAVIVGQPENSSTLACVYVNQAAADAAFAAWLAQFTVSGGCAPQGSYGQPIAPSYCGGTVSVTYTVTDRCYQTTSVTRTFTIGAATAVVFNCGNDVTVPACSSQAEITAAWNAFLASTTASGGCNGALTRTECPMPTACGGYADVTWTYTVSSCGEGGNTTTCTRRFTVAATSPVVFNCGSDVTISGCGSQTAVDAAWNAFLNSTTASGGCNGIFSRTTPNSPTACGGSVAVTWTYTATACGGEPTTQTCTRTFTVTPSGPVTITAGNDVTLPACSTQAQLDAAWNAFLASTTATGGCEGALTTSAANPPSLCGGFADVTWSYTVAACGQSTCPGGTNTQTVTRRFTVAAPEAGTPVLTCPANIQIPANQTEAAINQAFAAWLATASGTGGCNGVLTNNSTGAPACGDTATVVFTYTTTCEPFTTTCTATFSVPPCDSNSNTASLGDFVWNDLNQNGIQDAGEPGIAGVNVSLSGCSVAMNTTTDANGFYLFSSLPACNNYTVTFTTPAGYTASLSNQGANDAVDSDAVAGVATGINLAIGQANMTIDAGFYNPPTNAEGCTLGYWKNHTNRWCGAYRTCDRFGDVFVNAPSSLANLTLLQALNLGGGGIYNLARQGVAALLNACSDEVDYDGYNDNTQSIIDAINQAYASSGSAPGTLASQLDTFNNAGCPLGGTRATTASNCTLSKTSKMGVTVYPNPTNNNFNLDIKTENTEKIKVEVFDMIGRSIDTQEFDPKDSLEVKIGGKYPTGVYNVVVTQGTDVKTARVIKR